MDTNQIDNRFSEVETKQTSTDSEIASIKARLTALESGGGQTQVIRPKRVTHLDPNKNHLPILSNGYGDVGVFPYSAAMKIGTKFRVYYTGWGVTIIGEAPLGLADDMVDTGRMSGGSFRGPILYARGSYWGLGHHWVSGQGCFTDFYRSLDGRVWIKDPTPALYSGEDQALLYNSATNEFWAYIRPLPGNRGPRTIGLMKSSDFVNWSPIQNILSMDSEDLAKHQEFYSMPVMKVGNDYFGILNVLQKGNAGQDVEQLPPYSGNEQTVTTQLTHSTDGVNFTRCNNKAEFLPRLSGVNQIYATTPVVDGNKVIIYTLESNRRHTDYENTHIDGRYFSIGRYEISTTELLLWKP